MPPGKASALLTGNLITGYPLRSGLGLVSWLYLKHVLKDNFGQASHTMEATSRHNHNWDIPIQITNITRNACL